MLGNEPAGLGLGVGTEAVVAADDPDGGETCPGAEGEVALSSSAAILTLVGTRFNLIAPPPEDDDMDDERSTACDRGGLNGLESDSVGHGEGNGFRGEIIDAEVERDGT